MGKGDWGAAIADFRQAIAILPDYTFAQANLGQALYQVGEREEAISIWETASQNYPGFADVQAALTGAYAQMGKIKAAKQEWEQALQADDRYRDLQWVASVRRWSPASVDALAQFLLL